MTRSAWLRASIVLGLFAVFAAGCFGQGPKLRFYTLSSASNSAVGPELEPHPELGLVIGPIEFPRYLDRPEIVRRDGSHRLVLSNEHRWAGSLRSDFLRVVADDLGRLLGTARVAVYPDKPRFSAAYRLQLDVREFEGVSREMVVLRVRWTIVSTDDGRALAVEESRIHQPVASGSYEDLVTAESDALGVLCRQIAERLAALLAP